MGLSGDTPIFLFTSPESNPSHPPTPPIHPKTQLPPKPQVHPKTPSPIVQRPSFSEGIKKKKKQHRQPTKPKTPCSTHRHTGYSHFLMFPYVLICSTPLNQRHTCHTAAEDRISQVPPQNPPYLHRIEDTPSHSGYPQTQYRERFHLQGHPLLDHRSNRILHNDISS